MATITTDTYLDGGTARTAGEAWTCNGGKLTVRTDTRWHANAPASMTGSLGSITVSAALGGGVLFDATDVRWLPFDTGTSTVPAIGQSITQGGVTGYLLGVWDTITSAPTAVGASMPTNGFIKLREVTGGAFAAGALTGIGANATAADRTGWIEVVMDQSGTLTLSRKGTGSVTRGDWFYLDDTNGSVGQVIDTPTNGGGATTFAPGIWIETGVGTDTYEFWPGLNGSTNGWAVQHLGAPVGATDRRQSFVKSLGSGQVQIGESSVSASLTYTITSSSGTYTWANDIATVTFTAHGLSRGESVYLDFTSGSATADGVYEVEQVSSANAFTVALSGAGTGGNVTLRARIVISYANHPFAVGNTLGINTSSGDLSDGTYEVVAVVTGASGTITIAAAPTAGTGGNLTIEQTIGHVPVSGCKTRIPNVILRQCTTGARATNAAPHGTIATRPDFTTTGAGVVDHEYTYGDWYYLTLQAYQTRLVNVATFDAVSVAECATALDLNNVGVGMHGALDIVTLTLTSNFAGGTINNSKFFRGNTPGTGDHAVSIATCAGQSFSNSESGIIQFARSSGLSWNLSQTREHSFINCRGINGSAFTMTTCADITIDDYDYVDRFIGFTNATSANYVFAVASKCSDVVIDGVTEGYGTIERQHAYSGILTVTACDRIKLRNCGTRVAPLGTATNKVNDRGVIYASGGNNADIRLQRCYVSTVRTNIITDVNSDKNVLYESVIAKYLNTYLPFTFAPAALNAVIKGVEAPLNTVAANASVYGTHLYDQYSSWFRILSTYTWSANVVTVSATAHGLQVGEQVMINFTSGGTSGYQPFTVRTVTSANAFTVYLSGSGTAGNCIVFKNVAISAESQIFDYEARLCLPFNEATAETSGYVTLTGTPQFTSAPGLTLPASGDNVVFESQYRIKGTYGGLVAPVTLTGTPAVQASTYTWAANVLTVTFTAHGLAVGDTVFIDATSGGLADGTYVIAGITSANVYTISLTGSGTAGNANVYRFLRLEYAIDTGAGYGSWHNLDLYKAGVSMTAASLTVTMQDTSDIEVGDIMFSQGINGAPPAVASIDSGTQITLASDQIVLTGSNLVARFGRFPTEDLSDSSTLGYGLKIRVSSPTPGSTIAITYLTIPIMTTAALRDYLYPLDTNTITLTGLKDPTEVRIFDSGTATEITGQESVTSGTYSGQIDAGTYSTIDISILSLGYQNTRLLEVDISGGDVTIPVQQIVDRQYANI